MWQLRAICLALFLFLICQPAYGAEEDKYPPPTIRGEVEIDDQYITSTFDGGIANIRFKYNPQAGNTDEIAFSFRVIGRGKKCLEKPLLLGIMVVPQIYEGDPNLFGDHFLRHEEGYLQLHYLTKTHSIRGYIPVMKYSNGKTLYPILDVERLVVSQPTDNLALILRGRITHSQNDLGLGLSYRLGKHATLQVTSNDPHLSIRLNFEHEGLPFVSK